MIDKNEFIRITILRGAYELEFLYDEIRRINIEEGHFTEVDYPFTKKPILSTLRSFVEVSRQESLISFTPNDSIKDFLAFNPQTVYANCNLTPTPVSIFVFDNIFLEADIAQGMIFIRKISRIFHDGCRFRI